MRFITVSLILLTILVLGGCSPAALGTGFLEDHTAPTVGISSPGDGTQIHGGTTVSFFAFEDESNINWVEVTANGATIYSSPGTSKSVTGSASFTPSAPGDYVITIMSESLGGEQSTSVTVHFAGF